MKPFKQPVNCKYGAPMGRYSDNPTNFDGLPVTLSLVTLTDGYDDGGAYWGDGAPLFCAIGENEDEEIVHYFRQPNRSDAVMYLENYGATVAPESDDDYLETMVDHYLIAALWSSTDDDGNPFDEDHTIADVDPASRERCKKECKNFIELAGTLLTNWSPDQAGHDFWLSCNGHGAGFFDRDEIDDYLTCKALQEIARKFGECHLYVTEIDGKPTVEIE